MKIIKLLFNKYILSLSICLVSCIVIFFIFSLLGNLNEDYLFNIIIKISFLNSLQILTYVPAFLFLISVILFTIFLRSKNELIIIKSYMNSKLLIFFILPIVVFFTIIEFNKKGLGDFIEDKKANIINEVNDINTKIIVNRDNNSRTFIVIKNLNPNNSNITEYRSFDVFDKKIKFAQYSDNLIFSNNALTAKSYTQYKDNVIQDFDKPISYYLNFNGLFEENFIVKDISKKGQFIIDIRFINISIFFVLFFSYIFLIFLSKSFVSSKYSLKKPIFLCLIILIYSFVIFNNSLSFYRQEFEFLASFIAGLFFLKVYINE